MYFTNSQETWDLVCVLGPLSTLSFSQCSKFVLTRPYCWGVCFLALSLFQTHRTCRQCPECACFLASHGEKCRLVPFTSRNSLGSGVGLVDSSPSMPKSVQFYWKHWCTNLCEKKTSPEPAVQCLDERKLLNWPIQGLWNRRTWEEGSRCRVSFARFIG